MTASDRLAPVRALARGLGLDVAVPVAGYAWLAAWMWPEVWIGRFNASPLGLYSGSADHQGTIWFYRWLRRWWRDGEPLLLTRDVCAPHGEFLRTNFPNRIDAWLAQPFLAAFDPPVALSLFVLAVPALAGLAAYALARQFTADRVAAWLGGLPFAFQLYVAYEVSQGRPVTALLAPGCAFLAAFAWCLRARGRAMAALATVTAGLTAALAAEAYLPHAPYLGALAACFALARLARPAEGVNRWRPLWAGPTALLVALLVAAPYLYEVTVQRRFTPGDPWEARAAAWAEPVRDPRAWPELVARLTTDVTSGTAVQGGPIASSMGFDARAELGPWYRSVQAESLPWDWPWASSLDRGQRLVHLGVVWLVGGVALALLARGRGVGFLALAVGCYLLSLGPAVMHAVAPRAIDYVLLDGSRLALPTRWILDALPTGRMFLRPYRLAPFVHLFLGMGLAMGVAAVAAGPDRRRRVAMWLAGGVLATGALSEVRAHPAFALPSFPWQPSPFLERMGDDPQDYAIIELPMGVGQRRAAAQLVHDKRRSEPMQDIRPPARVGPPMPQCYRLPWLQGLWALGLPGEEAAVAAGLTAEARAEARAAGFRYVVWWVEIMIEDRRLGEPRLPSVIRTELDARLGPPVHADDQVIVWEL